MGKTVVKTVSVHSNYIQMHMTHHLNCIPYRAIEELLVVPEMMDHRDPWSYTNSQCCMQC